MNWRIVRAIAAKDLKEVRKNRIAVMATLILSLIFSIAMPLGVIALPSFSSAGDLAEIAQLIELLPPEVAATLDAGLGPLALQHELGQRRHGADAPGLGRRP
jgi:hypothetical protein